MKAKRKLIQICLFSAAMLPAAVQAQFTFTTNNGAITITGYTGSSGIVTIPSITNGLPVTSIGNSAFYNKSSLTNVIIPNSITNIGSSSFYLCTSLTNVTIPNSVISIGSEAFYACYSLTSIMIPSSVTNIGSGPFAACTSLMTITVDINNPTYTSAGGVLFNQNQTMLIQFPGAIAGSYTISNSVASIGDYAFYFCTNLTSVAIPDSVTNIGSDVFFRCASLTAITVNTNNSAYSSEAGVLFNQSQTILIQFPGGIGGSYTIPDSVTNIVGDAFFRCTSLTNIAIDNNVTTIGNDVFVFCTGITSITIPNNVISIGNSAFASCTGLTNVTIGDCVTSIGSSAFIDCYSLTNITLGNSVTNIGTEAFENCNLTSIIIPNSVTSIGAEAFYFCTSLTNVTIGGTTSIGSYAFSNCSSLRKVYFQWNSPTPTNDLTIFANDSAGTVYYLPGTKGWGTLFDGWPTMLWFLPNPLILNNGPGFGVQTNGFGFTISWATNIFVVVEATTNLANLVWSPMSTNTLTGGTSYFSDPQWTNYPERFYRLSSQ